MSNNLPRRSYVRLIGEYAAYALVYAQGQVQVSGQLHNVNTFERFKGLTLPEENTRASYIRETAAQIWADIISEAAENNPSLLWRFVAVSFAELKKYHFYYW